MAYYHLPENFHLESYAQGLKAPSAQVALRTVSKTFKNKERYTVPCFVLFIPLRGQKIFYQDGQEFPVEAGQLLLIRAGARLSCDLSRLDDGLFEALMFQMHEDFLAGVLHKHAQAHQPSALQASTPQDLCLLDVTPLLKSCIESLLPFFDPTVTGPTSLIQLKMEELLLHLLHLDANDTARVHALLAEAQAPERAAYLRLIQQALESPMGIEQMARAMHQSPTTFKKNFKQYLGLPPAQYLQDKRLEEAHYLLRSTDQNITEIGLQCGFESPSHFIQVFKRKYHMTPGQLKKSDLNT